MESIRIKIMNKITPSKIYIELAKKRQNLDK